MIFLAERGVQVKASSTTRAIQTGKFTRETSTETTPVETRDKSTQKKLRKPKVCNFGHQFRPRNLRTATTQWDERDISHISTAHDRISKVDENMKIAQKRDAILNGKFYFRRNITTR